MTTTTLSAKYSKACGRAAGVKSLSARLSPSRSRSLCMPAAVGQPGAVRRRGPPPRRQVHRVADVRLGAIGRLSHCPRADAERASASRPPRLRRIKRESHNVKEQERATKLETLQKEQAEGAQPGLLLSGGGRFRFRRRRPLTLSSSRCRVQATRRTARWSRRRPRWLRRATRAGRRLLAPPCGPRSRRWTRAAPRLCASSASASSTPRSCATWRRRRASWAGKRAGMHSEGGWGGPFALMGRRAGRGGACWDGDGGALLLC